MNLKNCQNCLNPAIVQFDGIWLCKDCFNKNMEQAGAIIHKIRKLAEELCQRSKMS